jgi:hypothetical protein
LSEVPADGLRHGAPMLREVTAAATAFLVAAQTPSGWWRDFMTLAGESDEWVTGYVGTCLAVSGGEGAERAARSAWDALRPRQRRISGGWGYNRRVPADADSTAWALQLAAELGAARRRAVRRGRRCLARHATRDGMVATYRVARPIRRFTGTGTRVSFDGWTAPHLCVTAAAAAVPVDADGTRAPAADRLERLVTTWRTGLLDRQEPEGCWRGYWWGEPHLPTLLAVRAIPDGPAGARARVRAAAWARRQLGGSGGVVSPRHPSGDPLLTACCLEILARCGSAIADLSPTIGWLAAAQGSDGGWPGSAALRIPPPGQPVPDRHRAWVHGWGGGGGVVRDQHGLFTTATVLSALIAAGRSAQLGRQTV